MKKAISSVFEDNSYFVKDLPKSFEDVCDVRIIGGFVAVICPFSEQFIEKDIFTLPKVIILVDGLDESAPYECWIERIRQTDAITKKYPQVRFCFTSRPAAFSDPRKYVRVKRLNSSGDVPTYKLFDLYAEAYGVKVKNAGWVKHALSTPLSLKLFCELHQGTSVDISNSAEISIARLWRAKIDLLESSFGTKCNIAQQNQYIFCFTN